MASIVNQPTEVTYTFVESTGVNINSPRAYTTDDDWEKHKELILALDSQGIKKPGIIRELSQKHGLTISDRQLKHRLTKWKERRRFIHSQPSNPIMRMAHRDIGRQLGNSKTFYKNKKQDGHLILPLKSAVPRSSNLGADALTGSTLIVKRDQSPTQNLVKPTTHIKENNIKAICEETIAFFEKLTLENTEDPRARESEMGDSIGFYLRLIEFILSVARADASGEDLRGFEKEEAEELWQIVTSLPIIDDPKNFVSFLERIGSPRHHQPLEWRLQSFTNALVFVHCYFPSNRDNQISLYIYLDSFLDEMQRYDIKSIVTDLLSDILFKLCAKPGNAQMRILRYLFRADIQRFKVLKIVREFLDKIDEYTLKNPSEVPLSYQIDIWLMKALTLEEQCEENGQLVDRRMEVGARASVQRAGELLLKSIAENSGNKFNYARQFLWLCRVKSVSTKLKRSIAIGVTKADYLNTSGTATSQFSTYSITASIGVLFLDIDYYTEGIFYTRKAIDIFIYVSKNSKEYFVSEISARRWIHGAMNKIAQAMFSRGEDIYARLLSV
ncbi:hypothetical protein H072_11262 [Dactylellina haptotyla CBS 200.50]|uniref:Clr5 domain-containing protein n=1 Tax=Dactylellina haptotyla (strain CBS 200.50) TaxID=1284197 RepID=S7ZXD9_DACHA|nr:hypothetical protein H072_11262 [Dactylellina haptotyla CBS 200.50]